MEIYLVRHTKVAVGTTICYGQTDVHPADTFDQEAASLQRRLAGIDWEVIYTSPLSRCARLVPFFSAAGIITDPRLMEFNFGEWELQPWKEIDPVQLKQWSSDFVNQAAPAGETYGQLYERVIQSWNEILERDYQGNVIVLTHGGVIRAILAHLLSIPLQKSFHLDISYGSVSCVHVNTSREHGRLSKVLYINRV
jgi:alpha-ribazole phosphatase